MQPVISRIFAPEMQPEHITALIAADEVEHKFNHLDPGTTIRKIWHEEFQLWQLRGGVLLTEINIGGDGSKRLNLVRWAGVNVAQQLQEISKAVQHIARDLGCAAIETMVNSEKLARALKRTGMQRESVTMVLELTDG